MCLMFRTRKYSCYRKDLSFISDNIGDYFGDKWQDAIKYALGEIKKNNHMALSKEQINNVEEVLKASLRNKFQNYKPETGHMPFHYRLLGRDRMALFSFLQSLNTTFGTSIYEPVAKEIAKTKFKRVETQYVLGNIITQNAQKRFKNNERSFY